MRHAFFFATHANLLQPALQLVFRFKVTFNAKNE